ncbi:MAG: TolB family protein, partial [Bdellovibrionota bacterium]
SLDVSPSGGRVAWTTENGAARIDSVALPTPVRETAEEIRFGNSEDEVFVSTPSQTTLIFHRGSGNTWNLTQTLQGIEAAPSASEDRLAFISTNRHTYGQLVVVDRKTGRSLLHQTFSGQATSARVAHEPAWSGDGTIAYWVDQDVSHAEMRILDLATEQEHAVPFELGPGARHNVICPMWAGDALYFAQWTQAGYSIARLPGATADRPLPFAVPRANGSHYICPITARGAGL